MTPEGTARIPRHVAIIMDGNGRWAVRRGLPRVRGHREGVETVRRIARAARDIGIDYLTLFSFSTENWTRPRGEIGELFSLLKTFIRRDLAELHHNNVRVRVIGERTGLPGDILPLLIEAEKLTKDNTGQTLVIAFNYGSRGEIVAAAKRLAKLAAKGEIDADAIDATQFETMLETHGIPDPDLIIRTSGEQRLSNFLLWQAAYAELVFVDTLWPDFDHEDLAAAIECYATRKRRFGGVDENEEVAGPRLLSETASGQGQPSELLLRIVSALVLIAIVLTATWYGGSVFTVMAVAVSALLLFEYLQIVRRDISNILSVLAISALTMVLVIWYGTGALAAFVAFAICFLLLFVFEVFTRRSVWAACGLAYATLPLFALVMLRGEEQTGLHAVFLIFACVWGADTLAYFAGRTIGGPKLAPVISPKKTWSGFFGGLAGSVLAASAILMLAGYGLSAAAVVLMIVLSVISQMGDLLESWIKRFFGKKDSGKIIPGHGGIMDRIDGLITASIAAWLIGGLYSGEPLIPGSAANGLFAAFILP